MSALPAIHIDRIRTVRIDGQHNAFTDLCRFQDRLYLAFRSCPDGHGVFASSRIVVLASDDGDEWTQVYTCRVPQRDTRDPHFLVFRSRLFVYTGTWLAPAADEPLDLNDHLGYCAHTADGQHWDGPVLLEGTYGHYIWRAAACADRAYLCARRRTLFRAGVVSEAEPAEIESAMLESDDGLVWRFRGLFADKLGDETAFLFEADGSVLALVRDGAGERARICRASPPYADWQRVPLERNVGGPLLARWGERYLVAGRKTDEDGPRTALSWLVGDELVEAAELPSGGDNSYPGFVALDESRGLLSYYSSHEGSTSIYLAELRLG